MYCGGGVMIPLVGAYPARVEYAVADETIAKVQSSSPDYLELLGLKEGETTVTVRASDGRTTTEKVRVLPTAVTETEPPVLTTTARFNPDPPATATTVTVITPDPATATTKWWYPYETTEPAAATAAVATEAMQDSATHTTAAELTDEVLPDTVRGDANCDGFCDVADAVLIARFAAEDREATMTDQGRKNADVTHDNNVDSQDAARILQYIAKKITFEDLAE
ncbi:MAG: pilus assembly protein N-terminal domain-containing protein, partial [Oscillospiraceae bacterium]|nr:pilus assembly protein N-terminal domain-containing protein [Oscillospiraceae bacterium]